MNNWSVVSQLPAAVDYTESEAAWQWVELRDRYLVRPWALVEGDLLVANALATRAALTPLRGASELLREAVRLATSAAAALAARLRLHHHLAEWCQHRDAAGTLLVAPETAAVLLAIAGLAPNPDSEPAGLNPAIGWLRERRRRLDRTDGVDLGALPWPTATDDQARWITEQMAATAIWHCLRQGEVAVAAAVTREWALRSWPGALALAVAGQSANGFAGECAQRHWSASQLRNSWRGCGQPGLRRTSDGEVPKWRAAEAWWQAEADGWDLVRRVVDGAADWRQELAPPGILTTAQTPGAELPTSGVRLSGSADEMP